MRIEAESRSHAVLTHCLEAYAVNQTQFPSRRSQHSLHPGAVLVLRDPIDVEQRNNIFMKGAHGREANPVLQ